MRRTGGYGMSGALMAAMLGTAALADVKSGVEAYQRGDYETALAEWRPLADRGDADAQFNLAQAYRLGRGVPASMDGAIELYRKAATQNHFEAQSLLGVLLFQNGKRAEAVPWVGKAADGGDAASQFLYGTLLFNGDMVGRDYARAYGYMTRAAAQGLPPARSTLLEMDKHIPLTQRQQGVALAARANDRTRVALAPRPMPSGSGAPVGGIRSALTVPVAVSPARTAAPTRVASTRPATGPAPASGGWRVQLGAFGQPAAASSLYASLQKRVGVLASVRPILVKAGAVTRLQAGPFASRAAAASICTAVRAAGQACFAVPA